MIREEYLRRLVDASHVELYLSGQDGARIYWPWRMEKQKEASVSYRNACERYVVDSDPLDDSVTNRDVLDTAVRVDAEIASLQDVYQDCSATADKLLEGLAIADDHEFDGTLLLPLQQPYAECWQEIGEPADHWIGLGGLKDKSDAERVKGTERFRDAAGYGPHVHGFGWGPNQELAAYIRNNPRMLDSLDYSTPIQSAPMGDTSGAEAKSVVAAYAGARLVRDLREVTSLPDDVDEPVSYQEGLVDL